MSKNHFTPYQGLSPKRVFSTLYLTFMNKLFILKAEFDKMKKDLED